MNLQITNFLEKHSIKYVLYKHPAVYTCDEAEKLTINVPGIPSKNLFLKDKKNNNYFLVILPAHKRMNMRKFGKLINMKNITFGNETELKTILGLNPGSVSPLGLLNDKKQLVQLYINKEIWDAEVVNFHPNINTESLTFTNDNFKKLIKVLNKDYTIIEINP